MRYIMTLVSLFAADSGIKHYIEKHVAQGTEKPILGGKCCIRKHHNTGAMLHLGGNRAGLVAALSLVFSAFMSGIFAAALTVKGNAVLKGALAMLLGGAYSNTYDRLKRHYVVDYVSFRFPPVKNRLLGRLKNALEAVVFNLSDFGIIIGAMLIVVRELFRSDKKAS
ncbi:signal peptidase II [Lachnospiraceae bacterium MD335]|jgi:signal peptidase II|nr:signal peptidase II [Lachnospiraceae bacterium MD335]NDO48399.1 signal peptidase II [Lachnospiraceae bacterium MD335]